MTTFRPHPERTRGFSPALILALACASLSATAQYTAAQTSIGLYSDVSGNTCSFSGNDPGLFTAYVVVRPSNGVSAVQFSAPVPACLGSSFVSELVPPGMLSLGSSQTGMSIALQNCSQSPISVLQITYMRSGSTDACCEYTIAPDPAVGTLAASDCFFQEIPMVSVASHFNADASCACVGNSPPVPPTNPSPFDGENAVSTLTSLSWFGFDVDDNISEYDLYFGTTPTPPLVAAGLTTAGYTPAAPLAGLTQHYWRVVARDDKGLEAASPTWTFTTRASNSAPHAPQVISPANGATGILVEAVLRWISSDMDGDVLVYDLYFGASPTPPLVATALNDPEYTVGPLNFATTYYWRIVARDTGGLETSGAVWSFETRPVNFPPNVPTPLAPVNGALNRPLNTTLEWTASDNDPGPLVSDVYFGTSDPPPLVVTGQSGTTYAPAGLAFETQYYWRIVVRDFQGAETSGPTWTFTTRPSNFPPNVPSGPIPANNAVNVSVTPTLSWQSGDLDGHAVTYDVFFGTPLDIQLVASNITTTSYNLGVLSFGTTYRWVIIARDELGAETNGPPWTFTTGVNLPPNLPTNPVPTNGAVNRPLTQTLAWQCTEPNGHAMTFDVYFGTSTPPPLVASNIATLSYNPGLLASTTTYYWIIVARDSYGLERSGPTWSFSTKANSPPGAPLNPSPIDHGASDPTPVLVWFATDVDLQPLTYDVYFGSTSPPPLVASGLTDRQYEPGTLAIGQYFWRVVASDGLASTSGPTWQFTVAPMGDVNLDTVVDLDDASCALGVYLVDYSGCDAVWPLLADVDCGGMVTPRDARCIHKNVIDGSCTFCELSLQATPTSNPPPIVSLDSTWEVDDTVYVRLAVTGVPSLEAFGFIVESQATDYFRASRRGATTNFTALRNSWFGGIGFVGGYALSGVPAGSTVAFIDLRFYADFWFDRTIVISNFADDLEGAAPLTFFGGGGGVPVLITRFDATPVDRGIDVRWELQSDEAMESYTLYRRGDGAALPIVVAQGPVTATSRSFVDTSVESGKTYHYELLIRATDGDEFRSPIATASTQAMTLSLGQNHPNPFNPQTVIPYELPASARAQRVRLWILDISGRIVRTLVDEDQSGGSHRAQWQGKDDRGESVSSGVYFYVLDVGGQRLTKKLVLLK